MSSMHRRWTAEQKREFVLKYSALPHGSRGSFAREMDVDYRMLRRWRLQLAAGTLEQGLVPREGKLWQLDDNREVARLAAQVQDLESRLVKAQAEKESQDRVIDALGKAIELLRDVRKGKGSKA
jgi:transposase-like protein